MVYKMRRLEAFSDWLKSLKDGLTRQRLNKRLRKVQLGNIGDVEGLVVEGAALPIG